METKIIILFGILLLMPLVSAQMEIELKPRYYVGGTEIIYTPDMNFNAISFEIIGENSLETRILDLQIIKSAPDSFSESLPDKIETLRILQTKTLWSSDVIDLSEFENGEEVSFILGVEGVSERGLEIYIEEIFDVVINKPVGKKNYALLFLIGERIYPSRPGTGIIIFFCLLVIIIFTTWYYKIPQKIENFRKKMYKRRHGK